MNSIQRRVNPPPGDSVIAEVAAHSGRVISDNLCLTFDSCDSFSLFPVAGLLGLLPMCWAWRLPQDAPFGEDGWIGFRLLGLL